MSTKMAHECLVCGTMLAGPLGRLYHLFGIHRSARNPNICNRCDTHMQEGRVIELSVIFADLTSFTEMTNRLGAERSYEVVETFFKMANDVLHKNGAFIDKYIGDAVMAIFNAPIPNAKHARGATTAALGIQAGMKSVSEELGLDLQARVGVATGYARVGKLGSNDRKDFTAIGDVVNLASRLEAFAMPGEVIVDGKAFAQVIEDYPNIAPEKLNVRGFAEPIEAYRINKVARESAPAFIEEADPMMMRQRISLSSVLFTIFAMPCAVATTLSPLAIVLGLGSLLGSLAPALGTLDAAQIRIPLQTLAVAGALINLAVIRYGNSRQQVNASETTLLERRKINFIVGLSIFSLLAVGYETYMHIFVLGMSYFEPVL